MTLPRRSHLPETCGGHLGHLFDDGPAPQQASACCIDSASIQHEPSEN